jgi:hypothetical protein
VNDQVERALRRGLARVRDREADSIGLAALRDLDHFGSDVDPEDLGLIEAPGQPARTRTRAGADVENPPRRDIELVDGRDQRGQVLGAVRLNAFVPTLGQVGEVPPHRSAQHAPRTRDTRDRLGHPAPDQPDRQWRSRAALSHATSSIG